MEGSDEKSERDQTFDYQSKLPSLPLPSLTETCKKYLQSVRPLVTEEEFRETAKQTSIFHEGIGRVLQSKLQKMAQNSRNWIADWWYDTYLDYRGPLPAISNTAGIIIPRFDYEKPEHGSQYRRGALWIYYLLQKFQEILQQEIPIQKLGKKDPMDMGQYLDFFCCGRIPGEKRDVHMHYATVLPKKDGTMDVTCNVKHIVVLIRGRIFKVPVFDNKGNVLLPPSIERQLEKVVDLCDEAGGEGHAVGSLTAADRDTYFKAYKHLCMLDSQNKVNVNVINEAIIAFAFDDVETFGQKDLMQHVMLGDCRNRWFDKNLIAITGTTGLIGTNNDHYHYDGNVGCFLSQSVSASMREVEYRWQEEYVPQVMNDPIEIQFVLDDYILNTIQETQVKHRVLMSSIDAICRPIKGFGKAFTKAKNIYPDTLVQMAIQLAYYKLHKKCAPTYESGTTRKFYHGRTETVRSCTSETKEWVESMTNSESDHGANRELFWTAVNRHDQLMNNACQGEGIDRHLLALKLMAKQEGRPEPCIFTDKSWKLSGGDGNFVISSSLSSFYEMYGCIAPMIFDGYGIFYNIDDGCVYLAVSAWKDSTETDCLELYDSILAAFHSIRDLISNHSKL